MDPRIAPVIDVHEVDGEHLIVAEIPELPPSQKPCFHKAKGLANGAYVRVADGDRKLNTYEVSLLQANRGQPREDQLPVHEARREDLDPALIGSFLKRVRQRRSRFRDQGDEQILEKLRVLVHSGIADGAVPSVGEPPKASPGSWRLP